MRKGFSMIMAIFVIVIMSAIGALVLSLSGKSVNATTAQYQRAQALLYAKSYTEYAILAVSAHDRHVNNNCVETIKGTIGNWNKGGYSVWVQISYIGPDSEIGMCRKARQLSTHVTTKTTPLTLIVDTYVYYKNINNPSAPKLTVHQRTVQKI